MTYKWGKKSLERLEQCDIRLQNLCNRMLARSDFDMTITCGHRGKEEQENAFREGKSKARFGQSKHNSFPSKAVDICPCPINWDTNDVRWHKMVALAYDCARELGIKIRCGAFFSFKDYPHIELEDECLINTF